MHGPSSAGKSSAVALTVVALVRQPITFLTSAPRRWQASDFTETGDVLATGVDRFAAVREGTGRVGSYFSH
ncbi:hypothetical protein BN2475_1250025 [Paraburkholderia ribeironis]|uniref:Uncharacterized protein n=1 Tax=Paraburkholderia ribeironis TaxID=1247936 RepID=A0A1N7SNT9_9BURK|nr:hypothetical protein BN2475_1250025 [Paraburkholderia ribeironis]